MPYRNSKNKSTGIRGISYTPDRKGYRVRWMEDKKEHSKKFELYELQEAIEFNEVDHLGNTDRGGFGSTGSN